MSSIRNTISQSLSSAGLSGYTRQAEPVIVALEEREAQIKNDLHAFADSKGLSSDAVEALFVEVGLSEPAPEPEVLSLAEGGQSLEAMIATLTEEVRSMSSRLDSAAQQASRHGIRF